MTDLLALPSEKPKSADGDDDDLDHLFCWCSEFVALCGTDLSDAPLIEDGPEERECVVCVDLEYVPCPRCGE